MTIDPKTQTLPEKIAERIWDSLDEYGDYDEANAAALIREALLGSELFKAAEEAIQNYSRWVHFMEWQDVDTLTLSRLRAALNELRGKQ